MKRTSAMLVAMTHLRVPGGAGSKMRVCRGREEQGGQPSRTRSTSAHLRLAHVCPHGDTAALVPHRAALVPAQRTCISSVQPRPMHNAALCMCCTVQQPASPPASRWAALSRPAG